MLSDTFKSARARTTALVIAFGVVAGGVAVTAAPSFAANGDQVDASVDGDTSTASASVSEESIAADASGVTVTGSGFTPGNLVYVRVVGPEGQTNWSWGTASHEVDASGAVSAELTSDEAWAEGDYSVVLYESEGVQASTAFAAVAPAATETPAPTETATPEPTETETATPEPTETETATPEPTETATEAPEPTLTEEPTLEPTETASVAPTATETATPSPTETEAPVAAPAVATEQASYTQEEAAEGITYVATGFTPGVELGLTLLLPDGTSAEFESAEPITPDADGNYAGIITYDAAWAVGDYGITLTTISPAAGEETGAPAADSARAVPLIVQDESELTASTESPAAVELEQDAVAAAEEQTAAASFAVTGETPATGGTSPSSTSAPAGNGGNGTGNGGGGSADTKGKAQSKSLATTGAEDAFGAAGIGLLVLGLGAAAVTGARFLSRRRES
ncbi:hypothetical protein [Pseudoclavibacter sp. VKM Ac-2867]|uniref:hypothetical protein n=1 Tax=Pseudoclavibacter sp. VKM Ac-2867 TaxID=2783829 RepID=UPI00188D7C76|nr:hypothetical protein [Pseudoclavibacter sp. VKM Ac-2867]MBF4460230.1 hypothetical protein [Pseudoclavibacter sp. VKM Ac-2867]